MPTLDEYNDKCKAFLGIVTDYTILFKTTCTVSGFLYFFKVLFGAFGYSTVFVFVSRGEQIGESLIEPSIFFILVGIFIVAVTKNQRVLFILPPGFLILFLMNLANAFISLNGDPNLGDVESSRTYCKFVEGIGAPSDEIAKCRIALTATFLNIPVLFFCLVLSILMIADMGDFKMPGAEPYDDDDEENQNLPEAVAVDGKQVDENVKEEAVAPVQQEKQLAETGSKVVEQKGLKASAGDQKDEETPVQEKDVEAAVTKKKVSEPAPDEVEPDISKIELSNPIPEVDISI